MDISVALCTYNGAAHLKEQLESIRLQTLQPGELVIRDDGSSDNTQEIVKEFALRAAFPVRFAINSPRLGVVRNFETAIRDARGRYIALCDQDDVWYSDKLAKEMAVMTKTERDCGDNVPILVHSDLRVVSVKRELIHSSMFAYQKLSPPRSRSMDTLLVQNFVTGCTVIINRALVDVALPIAPQAVMHDWWLALCASLYGEIRTLPESTIDYRQHAHNQVGARGYWSLIIKRLLLRVQKVLTGQGSTFGSDFGTKVEQAIAMYQHAGRKQTPVARQQAEASLRCFVEIFQSDGGSINRLVRALRCNVRPGTVVRRLNYLVRVVGWRARSSA